MSQPTGAEVVVDAVTKSFGKVSALRGVSLRIDPGEAVLITGRSGSGKSTLLALIGGLEDPDGGRVLIDGRAIWSQPHPAHVRRELVGFVFQRHLLLEALSARANVEVPLIGTGAHARERRRRSLELLGEVGLADRAEHLPSQLSGGERQRVAVARALANEPRLLLADEPTGALDSATSERILDLIFGLRDRLGMTMVVVSYDQAIGARADRTVTLTDGQIASELHTGRGDEPADRAGEPVGRAADPPAQPVGQAGDPPVQPVGQAADRPDQVTDGRELSGEPPAVSSCP